MSKNVIVTFGGPKDTSLTKTIWITYKRNVVIGTIDPWKPKLLLATSYNKITYLNIYNPNNYFCRIVEKKNRTSKEMEDFLW